MQFYGQFDPPVDRVLFERFEDYFRSTAGYFMESGAFDGLTECNCKFLEESFGWRGINVEPVPHLFHLLQTNRPQAINFNCALSLRNGITDFQHAVHPQHGMTFGNGSIRHTQHHRQMLEDEGCEFRSLRVVTRTYDDVVRAAGVPRIDFFSLDVEGHELEVLAGMREPTLLPRLLCVETGHDADGKIDAQVRSMGYQPAGKYLVNSFYRRAA